MFLLLLASVAAFTDVEYETEFKTFLSTHNKVYEEDELQYRFNVFKKSMDDVFEHNSGDHPWEKGLNQFSDVTQQEFEKIYLGYLSRPRKQLSIEPVIEAPTADVDWRGKGALTPIKDQAQCGSCWAFSSTGGMEGAEFIAKGKATSLSEQALVDCSGSYGNQGCNGGIMDNAFKYIKVNGLPVENDYPYTAKGCKCKSFTPVTKLSSFTDVTGGSLGLVIALVQQPISVAVDARKWSSYRSGVFSCSGSTQLNHGVLLVASYDSYWVIKNSFGPNWGMYGFIQLSKQHDCGVTTAASWPTIHPGIRPGIHTERVHPGLPVQETGRPGSVQETVLPGHSGFLGIINHPRPSTFDYNL